MQRLLSDCLRTWTRSVIEIRSRELSTAQKHNSDLLLRSFQAWKGRMASNEHNESLMENFIEVRVEETLRSHFKHWLHLKRKKRALSAKLETKLQDDKRMLLLGCLDRWHDKYREAVLGEHEEQIIRYRQEQTMRATFSTWQARTMVSYASCECSGLTQALSLKRTTDPHPTTLQTLPAIKFNNTRLRAALFHAWRKHLPYQRQMNRAVEFDKKRLLRELCTPSGDPVAADR